MQNFSIVTFSILRYYKIASIITRNNYFRDIYREAFISLYLYLNKLSLPGITCSVPLLPSFITLWASIFGKREFGGNTAIFR